ncbi:glycosyltransferase family 10 domain-containing protein [Gramella sp. KN1008]|uniref:glycosyltransferase family 10 domain-containing protein n=1 Tax=Gramella sp. KN1008 TaxID=2529298 RepID=UPI0010406C96|nr:glycosyltransferase family 10 [Gramella sp. KN1008]TBW26623.1 glycosyltransferase [Gramella sp. KN1008]
MKKIRIWFSDFYPGFNPKENPFIKLLSKKFEILFDDQNPDFLIYSCYGLDFLKYDCVRIFYTGENLRPDFNLCDYAIGFDYLDFGDRYLRFPNFALFEGQFNKLIDNDRHVPEKKYFCNFIYSNSEANPIRDRFYFMLNEYKPITSPGKHLNNSNIDIGKRNDPTWMFSKLDFQSRCKFTIAFENSSSPGYTTEKLMHAFLANSIPIYWGDPLVEKDFNSRAFINCHHYNSLEEVVQRIIELDKSNEKYSAMMNEKPFAQDQIPENLSKQKVIEFLEMIFNQNPREAIRRPKYGTTLNYENQLKTLLKNNKKRIKLNPRNWF